MFDDIRHDIDYIDMYHIGVLHLEVDSKNFLVQDTFDINIICYSLHMYIDRSRMYDSATTSAIWRLRLSKSTLSELPHNHPV